LCPYFLYSLADVGEIRYWDLKVMSVSRWEFLKIGAVTAVFCFKTQEKIYTCFYIFLPYRMNWLLEMATKFITWCGFREKFHIESHTLVQGVHELWPLISTPIFGFEWSSVHKMCIWCTCEFELRENMFRESSTFYRQNLNYI